MYTFLFLIFCIPLSAEIERRAIIDIGSGSIKMKVADVDSKNKQIIKIVKDSFLTISLKEHLTRSGNQKLDQLAANELLAAISLLKAQALTAKAEKINAIATAALREAVNAKELSSKISEKTNVPIFILDQLDEGFLGYAAVSSRKKMKEKESSVIWDIGGGSMQLISKNKKGSFTYYIGSMAAMSFKKAFIEEVLKEDPKKRLSPNPIDLELSRKGILLAESFANEVNDEVKNILKNNETKVYGIGSIHNLSLAKPMNKAHKYTRNDLEIYLETLLEKKDEELVSLELAPTRVTNVLLILGYMKQLGIQEIIPVSVSIGDGFLIHPTYWK